MATVRRTRPVFNAEAGLADVRDHTKVIRLLLELRLEAIQSALKDGASMAEVTRALQEGG